MEGLDGQYRNPKKNWSYCLFHCGRWNDSVTESTGSFDTVNLTPKTVGCFLSSQDLWRCSTTRSGSFIAWRHDRSVTQKIDLTAINGSGSSNQPTGILQTTGIGSVAIAIMEEQQLRQPN